MARRSVAEVLNVDGTQKLEMMFKALMSAFQDVENLQLEDTFLPLRRWTNKSELFESGVLHASMPNLHRI